MRSRQKASQCYTYPGQLSPHADPKPPYRYSPHAPISLLASHTPLPLHIPHLYNTHRPPHACRLLAPSRGPDPVPDLLTQPTSAPPTKTALAPPTDISSARPPSEAPPAATMPLRTEHPIVRVETGSIHTIETRDHQNLFGLWSGTSALGANACPAPPLPRVVLPVASSLNHLC